MTRNSNLEACIDRAFELSTPLCRARFGDLVADILANDTARPQGFERALLPTDAPAAARFAILTGDIPEFRQIVPEQADRVHVLTGPDFYAHWRPAPDATFAVFDLAARRGVTWYPEAAAPAGAIGHPCVALVHAAILETDWCVAHAAAVGRQDRFVLLMGPGKAGKSTATLACVEAGWDYAGDDLVLLDPARGLVAPMFSSARLRSSGADRFRHLADAAFMVSDDGGAPRFELRLPIAPRGGRVHAIVGIRRKGASEVRIEPGRAADYLGPLLRDSANRAPGYAAVTTRKLFAAARMAPVFSVDTGTDPAAIPAGLSELLGGLP